MNRREFLKSAVAVTALGALTRVAAQTGVSADAAKSTEVGKTIGQVTRRKFRDTDVTLPLLGYGMMRLPTKDGKIDREEAQKLVDTAMAAGINYFDTAEPYHNGESQEFVGEAFKKYKRDSYMLATKLPMWSIRTLADAENIFKGQLKSCNTEYFDFYLVHALNASSFRTFENLKLYDFLKKQKDEGKIKHLGFSFHDAPETLETIVNAHEWEFAQIQLNYVDWDRQNAKRMYEFLTSKKIPVIVMEPLQGGTLAQLTPPAVQILKQADANATPASWAFRYAGSLPNVLTVLSGMTTMDVLQENIRTFTDFKPLTDAERATLDKARDAYLGVSDRIPCTACKYCAVCPVRIDIPAVFAVWNSFCEKKDEAAFKEAYNQLPVKASACIGCRRCVRMCPQQIDIPTQLTKIAQAAGDNAGGGRGGRGGGRQGGGPGGGMGGFGGGMGGFGGGPGGMGGFGGGR